MLRFLAMRPLFGFFVLPLCLAFGLASAQLTKLGAGLGGPVVAGGGSAAFVQAAHASGDTTALTATFENPVTPGNTILTIHWWQDSVTRIDDVEDTKANTYAVISGSGWYADEIPPYNFELNIAKNVAGGSGFQVTANYDGVGSVFGRMIILEISGDVDVDQSAFKRLTATNTHTTNSITPTTNGQLIIAFAHESQSNFDVVTPTGVFTQVALAGGGDSKNLQAVAYAQPAAGAISASWTRAPSDGATIHGILSLKAAP